MSLVMFFIIALLMFVIATIIGIIWFSIESKKNQPVSDSVYIKNE